MQLKLFMNEHIFLRPECTMWYSVSPLSYSDHTSTHTADMFSTFILKSSCFTVMSIGQLMKRIGAYIRDHKRQSDQPTIWVLWYQLEETRQIRRFAGLAIWFAHKTSPLKGTLTHRNCVYISGNERRRLV